MIEAISFDSWGNIQSGVPTLYSFTGREWDAAVQMYYYRTRFYDPASGLFIAEDWMPIRHRPPPDPGGYSYAGGNPVRFTDPNGLEVFPNGVPVPAPPEITPEDIRKKARPYSGAGHPRFAHCYASCLLTKEYGPAMAYAYATAKEFQDWKECDPLNPKTHGACKSAFQPSDLYDNRRGRECPANYTCFTWCQDPNYADPFGGGDGNLLKKGDGPPGPYTPKGSK